MHLPTELIDKVAGSGVCAYRDGNVVSLCEECLWVSVRPSVIALRCLLELRILHDGLHRCEIPGKLNCDMYIVSGT